MGAHIDLVTKEEYVQYGSKVFIICSHNSASFAIFLAEGKL